MSVLESADSNTAGFQQTCFAYSNASFTYALNGLLQLALRPLPFAQLVASLAATSQVCAL
jgi:hypothetical protein